MFEKYSYYDRAFIYFVTDVGDYVYYAPNRSYDDPPIPNGYLMPATILDDLYRAEQADWKYHRNDNAAGFHLYYDEAYDLSSYRVHGSEEVRLHKHDPSELNPPEENAFPWGIVLGISLPAIAVGITSGVLIKKKRSKG